MTPVLRIRGFGLHYGTTVEAMHALDTVDLDLDAGGVMALVGESGSGKSTLGMAVGRLHDPDSTRSHGRIEVAGEQVLTATPAALRRLRREKLAYVFQNPIAYLDPTMRLDHQLAAAFPPGTSRAELVQALAALSIDQPDRVLRQFSHQVSGGMAQRMMIAMAIARRPALIVADEPTSAVDTLSRGQIMDLLITRRGQTAVLILTHDLGLAAQHCETVGIMYAGRIVEHGPARTVLRAPLHPYSRALVGSGLGREEPGETVSPVVGAPPALRRPASACSFVHLCPRAADQCRTTRPEPQVLGGHTVLCHRAAEAA